MITKVLMEMMQRAAEEINLPFTEFYFEEIRVMLMFTYNIDLDDDYPIDYKIMDILAEEVREWQLEKKDQMYLN